MPTTQVTPAEDALLQGIADSLFKARKVVVITGAGISTNSGIPDFRSENGLYSLIQAQFDNATREDVLESSRATSFDASRNEREPPTKRRRLSFEDSGICLSDDSQATEDQEVLSSSEEDKSRLSNGHASVQLDRNQGEGSSDESEVTRIDSRRRRHHK
ncbi:Hst3 protein [Colletotrichum higginsianum]|nr:Hst3 protein [Colletotrichum higginsianum]